MMPALAYLMPSLMWGRSAWAALVSSMGSAVGIGSGTHTEVGGVLQVEV
jgi:hypothetical protein